VRPCYTGIGCIRRRRHETRHRACRALGWPDRETLKIEQSNHEKSSQLLSSDVRRISRLVTSIACFREYQVGRISCDHYMDGHFRDCISIITMAHRSYPYGTFPIIPVGESVPTGRSPPGTQPTNAYLQGASPRSLWLVPYRFIPSIAYCDSCSAYLPIIEPERNPESPN
jgi:hypothetical protein